MVIECAHCQARFKLADDKLKPEGTKVRCSKCKEIFTVYPPADEAPAPLLTTAPPAPAAAPEAATQADQIDFGELTLGTAPSADAAADFSLDTPPSAPAPGGFELEDIAQSASGSFAATPAAEPGGFSDFDFDNSPATTSSAVTGDSTADFGSFDFDNTTAAPAPAAAPAGAANDPFAFDQTASGDFDFGDTPASAPASNSAAPSGGGSDDFDFSGMSFGDENATQVISAPPPPAPARSAPPAAAAHAQESSTQHIDPAPRPAGGARPKPLSTPLPRPRRHFNLPLGRIFSYLLLLAVFGAGGAAVYFYLHPGLFDTRKLIDDLISRSTAPKTEAGQIRLGNFSGSFVGGAAGSLFVVRGEATNEFKSPRSGIAVNVVLYDQKGSVLRKQLVYCGNPLSDETLRTAPFATIETAMTNQFGESLANVDVVSGKTLTFTAVFLNPPDTLSEYTVELAESAAAPKQQ